MAVIETLLLVFLIVFWLVPVACARIISAVILRFPRVFTFLALTSPSLIWLAFSAIRIYGGEPTSVLIDFPGFFPTVEGWALDAWAVVWPPKNLGHMAFLLYGLPLLLYYFVMIPILVIVFLVMARSGKKPAWSRPGKIRKGVVNRAARKRRKPKFGSVYFGKTSYKKPVWLNVGFRRAHAHLVGASGTGKTAFALMPILAADIHAGRGLLIIDGKGDIDLLRPIWNEVQLAGRESDFRVLDMGRPGVSQRINPLANGSQTELVDLVMQAGVWDNEYYKGQAEKALREAFNLLCATDEPFCLDDLCQIITSSKALKALGEKYNLDGWESFSGWLEKAHEKGAVSGLIALLEKVSRSEFSELFSTAEPEIDLVEAYVEGRIVYCALQTGRFPAAAPFVGRLLMAQLNVISNIIAAEVPEHKRKFFPVVIDEFAGFAYDEFVEFLNKSRASGFGCILSHQTLGDLNRVGDHFRQQVIGNTALKVVFRQENPEDAEIWGKLIGTKTAWKDTEQIEKGMLFTAGTGRGSRREVEEYVVHPNHIKSLGMGQAVVINKGAGIASLVDLVPMPRPPQDLEVPMPARKAGQGRGLRLRELVKSGES